jgi:hypothetical protein
MKIHHYLVSIFFVWIGTLTCFLSTTWSAKTADQNVYAELISQYVSEGVVDYTGLKSEEQKLNHYLKTLDETKPDDLSHNEQFALYINAYNAYTLKLILDNYPGIDSIKDIGGFFRSPWKKRFCKIGGKVLTLDEIEHEILRPHFKDPRVHFAINCASKGCPPLISEPYQDGTLDQQLDASAKAFINSPEKHYLEDNTLYVSSIFKWFNEDFKEGVVSFVVKYAQGNLKEDLLNKKDQIKIKYLDYDWSLNGK